MKNQYRVTLQDIPNGDRGIAITISKINEIVDRGSKDWRVISLARQIISRAPTKDKLAEIKAIFEFFSDNVTFRHDPFHVELLQDVKITLGLSQDVYASGDCDDLTSAVLAVAKCVGIPGRIITIASDPQRPTEDSHVYPELYDAMHDQWVTVDATPQLGKKPYFGWVPKMYYRKRIWFDGKLEEEEKGTLSGYNNRRRYADKGMGSDLLGMFIMAMDPFLMGPKYKEMQKKKKKLKEAKKIAKKQIESFKQFVAQYKVDVAKRKEEIKVLRGKIAEKRATLEILRDYKTKKWKVYQETQTARTELEKLKTRLRELKTYYLKLVEESYRRA